MTPATRHNVVSCGAALVVKYTLDDHDRTTASEKDAILLYLDNGEEPTRANAIKFKSLPSKETGRNNDGILAIEKGPLHPGLYRVALVLSAFGDKIAGVSDPFYATCNFGNEERQERLQQRMANIYLSTQWDMFGE